MAQWKKNIVTLNGVYRVHLNENTRINYVRAGRGVAITLAYDTDYKGYEVLWWDAYSILREN